VLVPGHSGVYPKRVWVNESQGNTASTFFMKHQMPLEDSTHSMLLYLADKHATVYFERQDNGDMLVCWEEG
jgi:hypothetical protein